MCIAKVLLISSPDAVGRQREGTSVVYCMRPKASMRLRRPQQSQEGAGVYYQFLIPDTVNTILNTFSHQKTGGKPMLAWRERNL